MDIGIYTDRATLLKIAEQIRSTFADSSGHTDTLVYGQTNELTDPDEVRITFSNDDSEPEDGGYQNGGVIVEVEK
jgi:hypothetical protein